MRVLQTHRARDRAHRQDAADAVADHQHFVDVGVAQAVRDALGHGVEPAVHFLHAAVRELGDEGDDARHPARAVALLERVGRIHTGSQHGQTDHPADDRARAERADEPADQQRDQHAGEQAHRKHQSHHDAGPAGGGRHLAHAADRAARREDRKAEDGVGQQTWQRARPVRADDVVPPEVFVDGVGGWFGQVARVSTSRGGALMANRPRGVAGLATLTARNGQRDVADGGALGCLGCVHAVVIRRALGVEAAQEKDVALLHRGG